MVSRDRGCNAGGIVVEEREGATERRMRSEAGRMQETVGRR